MTPIFGSYSICLLSRSKIDIYWLWHRRLSHLSYKNINKMVTLDLVRGFLAFKFPNDLPCAACEQGKQSRKGHTSIVETNVIEP